MKENIGWHFTRGNKLRDGRPVPPAGEWLVHEGKIELCREGLHCSIKLIDALRYAPGATLHQVRFGGDVFWGEDKLVSSKRAILRTLPETKTLSVLVEFAQWCAHRAAEAEWAAMTTAAARWAAAGAEEAAAVEARAAVGEAARWAARAARAARAGAAEEAEAAEAAAGEKARKAEEEIQNAKLLALVEEAFLDLGGGL